MYDLATTNCQNCKHCKFIKKNEAICTVRRIDILYEKLTVAHKRECKDYEFWCEEKVKEREKK